MKLDGSQKARALSTGYSSDGVSMCNLLLCKRGSKIRCSNGNRGPEIERWVIDMGVTIVLRYVGGFRNSRESDRLSQLCSDRYLGFYY
jgi:hypothetical protein